MIQFVTWKWGTKFTAEHVNVLDAMLRRRTREPHHLLCFTDRADTGISADVRQIQLPPKYFMPSFPKLCYPRLWSFSPTVKKFVGDRFINIDLDCVIVSDITPLFNRDEDFVIWGHPKRGRSPYCGSLWMLRTGARARVWDEFSINESPKLARDMGYGGTDQAWINYCLYPGEATWTHWDGIYDFKNLSKQSILPINAKIVFFNGRFDPNQSRLRKKFKWIRDNWHV